MVLGSVVSFVLSLDPISSAAPPTCDSNCKIRLFLISMPALSVLTALTGALGVKELLTKKSDEETKIA